MFDAISFI